MKARFIRNLENQIPQKLVVFGTSLSYHLAPHLRAALTEKFGEKISVINAGMSAKASRSALVELETKVLSQKPDVLTIEFAVNDAYSYEELGDETLDKGISLEESGANLQKLGARIEKALPQCEIWILTTNPTFYAPQSSAFAGSRRPDLEIFYENYRKVARENGWNLLDLHAFWSDLRRENPPLFQKSIPDGAHPNPTALRNLLVPQILKEWGVLR